MKKAFKSVFTVGGSGSGGTANNSKIATKNADYDEQQQHNRQQSGWIFFSLFILFFKKKTTFMILI